MVDVLPADGAADEAAGGAAGEAAGGAACGAAGRADLADPAGRARGGGLDLLRHVGVRIGAALLSLLVVLLVGFFLFRVVPGDPVTTMTRGRPVTHEQIAQLRHRLGLDRSLPAQFVDYLWKALHADLGTSFQYQRPVGEVIGERFWNTILLVGTGTVLAVALGLWLGTRAAWRRGSRFDHAATSVALTFWSMPTFWLGMIVLMGFGVGVGPVPGLFPVGGMRSDDVSGAVPVALDVAHHMVLPVVTFVAVVYAQYLLVMRSSLLDEMDADYLTTARAKGLRDDVVRRRHAVPNALLPTVTLVFMHLGFVVSGAISVEIVFSWPGLGDLTYQALEIPDLPLLQGTFLVFSGAVIVMNTLAEMAYRFLDPRVRTT